MTTKSDALIASGEELDNVAKLFGTERRLGLISFGDETDEELRERLLSRELRFKNNRGSFRDIIHLTEQLIHRECPVGLDEVPIRRQVGLGLIAKNKTGNWFIRLKTACRAFWSCL